MASKRVPGSTTTIELCEYDDGDEQLVDEPSGNVQLVEANPETTRVKHNEVAVVVATSVGAPTSGASRGQSLALSILDDWTEMEVKRDASRKALAKAKKVAAPSSGKAKDKAKALCDQPAPAPQRKPKRKR